MSLCLLDTNVLLRIAGSPGLLDGRLDSFLYELVDQGFEFVVSSQNIIEFWNVATRPRSSNGFGVSPAVARQIVDAIENRFRLVPDSPSIHEQWKQLVTDYGVGGASVHDARLVATMNFHHISHVMTLNSRDFIRYPHITVFTP